MTRNTKLTILVTVLGIPLCFYVMYRLGQRSQKRITYFSELTERVQGRKAYLVDIEVICSNGKDLGKLQVDLNLANGKLTVVRDDSKLEPNCTR